MIPKLNPQDLVKARAVARELEEIIGKLALSPRGTRRALAAEHKDRLMDLAVRAEKLGYKNCVALATRTLNLAKEE